MNDLKFLGTEFLIQDLLALGKSGACFNSNKQSALEAHDSTFCLRLKGAKIRGQNRALWTSTQAIGQSST